MSQKFSDRHIGLSSADQDQMLATLGVKSRAALIERIVPAAIRRSDPMDLPPACSESAALDELKAIARKNRVMKNYIGQGYYGCHTPAVILRNVLENPAWYTAYTPYQAEISQGRLETLINFQTMICDLTGMGIANASMLDEATAAAEAMTLALRTDSNSPKAAVFFVADNVLPQTLDVIRTRAEPLGITVKTGPAEDAVRAKAFAALLQYPGVDGEVCDYSKLSQALHQAECKMIVAADLLALTLLRPPGEWGADIVLGSSQRFGMPLCAGGPHAAYLACRDEYKRSLPGRLVGVSLDAEGRPAYRLSLQTREQHIRREKATSNICTAQVLPAVVASLYAAYHGPSGLRQIATTVASHTATLAAGLQAMGYQLRHRYYFDTIVVVSEDSQKIYEKALAAGINLRLAGTRMLGISLDETTTEADVTALWQLFERDGKGGTKPALTRLDPALPADLERQSTFLSHPVFNRYHSETAMLRYLRRLSDRDLALDRSMIPLGSCTMKLNATSEMIPITWPEFANIHPFAPAEQQAGYSELARHLEAWLATITGYRGVSLQPNAGSQGEYAGLLIIRAYHQARGEGHRNVCLITASAHGTNPASAQMAGMQVVVTACDKAGNIDLADFKAKCEAHSKSLAAVMVTYPSTHGVFESTIRDVCDLVHQHGGRVYLDGANLNAMVGLAAPGAFGSDVSHLNLHKTFCIPHGGGGPGVGPVCVVDDLVPYLPALPGSGTPKNDSGRQAIGAISAAPLGNAGVLPITWMYCRMMGTAGLQAATEVAILAANYISHRLRAHYPTLYSANGYVAHECILDLRHFKEGAGVMAEDVAKRLIDYGFHAPTLSFPVANTLMVEPTESEPLSEIERFIEAMIAIRGEIAAIETGQQPQDDNPLKNAPHTAWQIAGEWGRGYSREQAAFPLPSLRDQKYWPPVARIDNIWGDRNLFCSCVPIDGLGGNT